MWKSNFFVKNFFAIMFCCIFNIQMVESQDVKTVEINSKFLGDLRIIKIWKPQNFKSEEATQVIYVFDPLWLFSSVCATVESYSNYKIDKIPQTIVVGVYFKNLDDRMDLGYSIQTEKLNKRGNDFFRYVHEEVDAYINNEFKFNPYRIYIGWSYLAQYGDYLIENKPDFYDAYIFFSPEEKKNNIDYFKLFNKRIYIASAEEDTQKRNDYAAFLYEKIKINNNCKIKYEKIINASHMDIYTKAFPYALDFIYGDYINQNKLYDSKFKSPIESYVVNEETNLKNYHTSIRKNAANFLAIAGMNGNLLTSAEVDSLVVNFKVDKNSDANLLEIIGGFYSETKKYNKAHFFLNQAIKNYKKSKFLVKDNMTNSYLNLGLLYLGGLKNNKKAFECFQNGYDITGSNLFNYYLAWIIINENKNTKEAFVFLDKYINNYDPSFGGYSLDNIYYLYAKGYYQLKDLEQAKEYNLKALDLNSENLEALALKKILILRE